MKKFFKVLTALMSLSLVVTLSACDDGDSGSDGGSGSITYSISVDKSSVTLAPSGEAVINVTTNGVFTAASDNKNITATASNTAKTVTIKASSEITEATTATVTLKLNDDSTKTATIAVTVDPDTTEGIDYYELTLTLDETVAAKASSITVYAEGKEDDETTAALKQTVTADYTAGETTATAKLNKAKANSWKYFNNIVVTVKDSENNELDVEYTPVYFDYSDSEFTGITVSAAVESKTFTINFEGFTIVGGSVSAITYATEWGDSAPAYSADSAVTVTPTVSEDGTKATFSVEKTNEFYIDWTAVVVKDASGTEIEINSGNTEEKKWYSYSADEWSNTLAVVTSAGATLISSEALTITAEGTYQLAVSYDSIKDYSTVYITLAAITEWGSGNYNLPCLGTDASSWKVNTAWVDSGAFVDENVDSSTGGYYAAISPSDYPDGVFITGKTGLAGTLFVSGSN